MERSNIVLSLRVTMVFINAKYSEDTFIRIIFKTENNCTPLFSKFCTELLDDSVHVSKRNPCV